MSSDRKSRDRRPGRGGCVTGLTLLIATGCASVNRERAAQPSVNPQPATAASQGDPEPWHVQRVSAGAVGSVDDAAQNLQPSGEVAQASAVELIEPSGTAVSGGAVPKPVRVAVQGRFEGTNGPSGQGQQWLPQPGPMPGDRYPIDLAAALQLAGANNLQIAVAAEQVRESAARLARSEVLWVPTLNFGVGYNRHDGQIQATDGEVVGVSRSSAFVGGGPRVGSAPLTGLSGGPPRLFVGLNPAEAYFQPLAARRAMQAASAERAATFNDTLLEVGLTYYDLTAAQMRIAIARETLQNARQLVRLTEDFQRAGAGLAADTARARAQFASARMELLQAEEDLRVTSAELARLLRLEPGVVLYPAETVPIPVTLVSTATPVSELIAQGLGSRPELARDRALVAQAQARLRLEHWRPWVPNVQLGNSFGGFGGGPNSFLGEFDTRNDFDALAVWEVENLGLGNAARRREAGSQQRQQCLQLQSTLDRIAAEIAQAYARAEVTAEQVEVAETLVSEAAEALPLNFRAIQGGQLRPIEALQAITQLADARRQYLTAVIEKNRAQLQLLRAIGNPPNRAETETFDDFVPLEPLPVPPEPVVVPAG